MLLEYKEINNTYLADFNIKNEELITHLADTWETDLVCYYNEYYGNLQSLQKEVDGLIMGWFTSPKELEQKALDLLHDTVRLYESQREYVLDYYNEIRKSKNHIAIELYSFAIGPLKDVIGNFGKANLQEFKEIEECSKLEHYSFKVNFRAMRNNFNGINPFDFTQLANETKVILTNTLSAQNLETFNNYNSIKDENSHEKKLLKKELQIEAVKAGISLVGAAFDALNQRAEQINAFKKEFTKVHDYFDDICDKALLVQNSVKRYEELHGTISKYYQIYHIQKQKLFESLEILFNTKEFDYYLKQIYQYKPDYIKLTNLVKEEKKQLPKKPSILKNIFTLGISDFIYLYKKDKVFRNVKSIEKVLNPIENNFRTLEEKYIEYLKQMPEYKSAFQEIKNFSRILKPMRESLNRELNLHNQ